MMELMSDPEKIGEDSSLTSTESEGSPLSVGGFFEEVVPSDLSPDAFRDPALFDSTADLDIFPENDS